MSKTIYNSLSRRPQNMNCSEHFVQRNQQLKQNRIKQYNIDPTICKTCSAAIDYERRSNKFCSSSCAAKHSNITRKPCKTGPEQTIFPHSRVTFKSCKTCNNIFPSKRGSKYCSSKCKRYSSTKAYRNACKFNLNNRDHTELFNNDMIVEFGWYQPSNAPSPNLEGVTWDHLYRCSDGYKNNVPADIMSHPANAEMLLWRENYHRKESQITYEQLLERIEKWDSSH